MDETVGFLIYAAVFRLAVVGAAVVTIILGYTLFVRGVMPRQSTDAGAEAGGVKLSVRNAAPGTCFALLGAAILAAMLAHGNPMLEMQRVQNTEPQDDGPYVVGALRIRGVGEAANARAARDKVEGSSPALARDRGRVRQKIEFLNRLPGLLRPELDDAWRRDAGDQLREIKLRLMSTVWAEDWGDVPQFRLWAEGRSGPLAGEAFGRAEAFYFAGGDDPA